MAVFQLFSEGAGWDLPILAPNVVQTFPEHSAQLDWMHHFGEGYLEFSYGVQLVSCKFCNIVKDVDREPSLPTRRAATKFRSPMIALPAIMGFYKPHTAMPRSTDDNSKFSMMLPAASTRIMPEFSPWAVASAYHKHETNEKKCIISHNRRFWPNRLKNTPFLVWSHCKLSKPPVNLQIWPYLSDPKL